MKDIFWLAAALVMAAGLAVYGAAQDKKKEGYTDTPVITGQKWKVHDADRPVPPVVTPGAQYGAPPSDAIVLFDGKDLSKWEHAGRGADRGKMIDAKWPVK